MSEISSPARAFADELRPAVLPKSVAAAVFELILHVIIVVSFTALIFSGPLASAVPYGIGLLLAGDAVLCAVVALSSSYGGSIAISQDVPSAVMAVAAASLLASLPVTATPAQQFATVAVMIAGTALATGAFLTLLGTLKLGRLVRFLPYPVMGGFLAGTGYLLTMGGLGVMLNTGVSLEMFRSEQLLYWAPGLALGAAMLYATERFKNPLTLPITFALALALFYAAAALTNTSLAQLNAGNWLLGPFPSGSLWRFPFSPEMLGEVSWYALLNQWPHLATVAMVSLVALLLNASGLELVIKRDLDLNRELVSAGIANVAGGLVGGTVGYHALSLSRLSETMGGGKRLTGILTGLLLLAVAVAGPALFGYVPRMAVAGLLIFLGLELLVEWVYGAWFRFPRVDFLILLAIVGVIAVRGFLEGVAVGLALAIILFLVSYSRIAVARYALSGKTFRSRVQRSPRDNDLLEAHGDELYVLRLQSFIFFGTADGLFEQIRVRARDPNQARLRFVVLDLARVTGFDSTALLSFEKLLRLAREQGMMLAIAGLQGRTREQFSRGALRAEPEVLEFFADLDHAVEWCENRLVAAYQTERAAENTLRDDLTRILPDNAGVEKLIGHMERREMEAGEYVMRQGETADEIFFVESGAVTAQLEAAGKEPVRLETMHGGRCVGEIGFYLGIPRSAAVIANERSIVYCLSRDRLERMEKTDPEAAYALHRIIAHVLGERVHHLTHVIDALES